ncbi:hypothetical protein [Pseudomonas izuensis]|nr:hypothetical protein [Pseudomonas izuensis]
MHKLLAAREIRSDTQAWSSASTANNYLTQGEPRTLKLSATVGF